MAGKRKPNPTHITRREYESHAYPGVDGNPTRSSGYTHGVAVPDKHLDEIAWAGVVRIARTKAEVWGEVLRTQDDAVNPWDDSYREYVERMAASEGLHDVITYTVGHIVWPDQPLTELDCDVCPFGGAL